VGASVTRRRAILAGAALTVLLVAFLAGRYSRPSVATKDEIRTVTDTKSAEQLTVALAELDRTRKELATWQARASSAESHVNTVVKWKYLPGGVVEIEKATTKDAHQEASSQGGTHETTDTTKNVDMKLHRDVVVQEHQTVVELHTSTPVRPKWSAAVLLGAQRSNEKAFTILGPLVGAVVVDHQFVGAVNLGAWAGTFGGGSIGGSVRGSL
jgi:hypothetical protein